MVQCDKCGKWFYKNQGAIDLAPEHDCKFGGPTNPYKKQIEELKKQVDELQMQIAHYEGLFLRPLEDRPNYEK